MHKKLINSGPKKEDLDFNGRQVPGLAGAQVFFSFWKSMHMLIHMGKRAAKLDGLSNRSLSSV